MHKANRRIAGATLTLFNLIANHLDTSGTTVPVLFIDVSTDLCAYKSVVYMGRYNNRCIEKGPETIGSGLMWCTAVTYVDGDKQRIKCTCN